MRKTTTGVGWMVLVVILVAALLSSCGGGQEEGGGGVASLRDGAGGSTTIAGRVSIEDAAIEFSRCMRDKGIDIPDIEFGPDGAPSLRPEDVADIDLTSPAFAAAFTSCSGILRDAGGAEIQFDPELQAVIADQLQQFSECMRTNGVADFPDPDLTSATLYPLTAFAAFQTETFQNALESCRELAAFSGFGDDTTP